MLLIKNAKILTMSDRDYADGGEILVQDGKIVDVGYGLSSLGAKTIDAMGLYLLPGIVDAHCHIGMWEDGIASEGDDGNEMSDPITPHLRAIDAINPEDGCFKEACDHGITTVATGPGSANPIGGQFLAMKTFGRYMDDMVIKEPLALKAAFGENPKRVYSGKEKAPMTRMGTAAVIREAFVDAMEYMKKLEFEDIEKRPKRNLRKEVLAQVLKGELFVKAHAHRADDILTALRIAKEFGFKLTLEHCTEGYRILDALKAANVGCILGPLLSDRSKVELKYLSMKAPSEFYKVGVKFALMTDHPVIPIQYLPLQAAVAVREGLPEREALKAITINAAEIIGLEDRVGSLAPNKDADFALYDAHPLDARAHVKMVVVNGQIVHEA